MPEKNKTKTALIKAKSDGKVFEVEIGNFELKPGDEVLMENDQCQEIGIVVSRADEPNQDNGQETITLIRKLNDKDCQKAIELRKEACQYLPICTEKIKKHNLNMELLEADLSLDGKKLTFYFSAPGRVDFRSLVPDLASSVKKSIRLQQVGARNKAKYVGGIGRCGRGICCRSFLEGELETVTTEMACDQNLGQMGSNRITGVCGKLMCCLKYELDYYKNTKKGLPEVGKTVKTAEGEGVVLSQNILQNKVVVELNKDKRVVEESC